jgi:hypothetical protein
MSKVKDAKQAVKIQEGILPDNLFAPAASADLQPVMILRQQAEKIDQRTDSLLHAYVVSYTPNGGTLVRHTFTLSIPAFDNYTASLFYVWHDTTPYPAHVLVVGQRQEEAVSCNNEQDFVKELSDIFRAEPVQDIIRQFLQLAQATNRSGGV